MYDMVGLLLMIRINYQHRLLMNKRRIPCLDHYLDRLNLQLWPRFKVDVVGSLLPSLHGCHKTTFRLRPARFASTVICLPDTHIVVSQTQ